MKLNVSSQTNDGALKMDIYLFEDFVDLEEAVNIQIFVPVSCLHVLSDS